MQNNVLKQTTWNKRRKIVRLFAAIGLMVCLLLIIKRKLENVLLFPGSYAAHPQKKEISTFKDRHDRNLSYLSSPNKDANQKEAEIYLFFPGNGFGMTEYSLDTISRELGIPAKDLFVFMYPGYGPSESGWSLFQSDDTFYQALDDFVQELIQQGYNTKNITLVGHSLGGAAVFYLGSRDAYQFKQAVTLATFASLPKLMGHLLSYIMHHKLDNLAYAKRLKCRWVGIHGLEDEIIPSTSNLRDLYEALPNHIKENSHTKLLPWTYHGHISKMANAAQDFLNN